MSQKTTSKKINQLEVKAAAERAMNIIKFTNFDDDFCVSMIKVSMNARGEGDVIKAEIPFVTTDFSKQEYEALRRLLVDDILKEFERIENTKYDILHARLALAFHALSEEKEEEELPKRASAWYKVIRVLEYESTEIFKIISIL